MKTQPDDEIFASAENLLPKYILDKSIRSGNELGWRKNDVIEVFEAIRSVKLAILGGQIRYALPDGICELYWLCYDSSERKTGEDWASFCNRTVHECTDKFRQLISTKDIEKDAVESFSFLNAKKNSGVNIQKYQIFMVSMCDEIWYNSL